MHYRFNSDQSVGLLMCTWSTGREFNGMKDMINEVLEIIQMSVGNYTKVALIYGRGMVGTLHNTGPLTVH